MCKQLFSPAPPTSVAPSLLLPSSLVLPTQSCPHPAMWGSWSEKVFIANPPRAPSQVQPLVTAASPPLFGLIYLAKPHLDIARNAAFPAPVLLCTEPHGAPGS